MVSIFKQHTSLKKREKKPLQHLLGEQFADSAHTNSKKPHIQILRMNSLGSLEVSKESSTIRNEILKAASGSSLCLQGQVKGADANRTLTL